MKDDSNIFKGVDRFLVKNNSNKPDFSQITDPESAEIASKVFGSLAKKEYIEFKVPREFENIAKYSAGKWTPIGPAGSTYNPFTGVIVMDVNESINFIPRQ